MQVDICVSKATGKTRRIEIVEPFVTGIIDPPWPYTVAPGKANRVEKIGPGNLSGFIQNKNPEQDQYPVLSIANLKTLPIGSLIGGYLFLWCVSPFLRDGLAILDAWGFEYITTLCWAKYNLQRIQNGEKSGGYGGVGFWFLGNHELVLVAKKPTVPSIRTGCSSLFVAPKLHHSAKIDNIHTLVEKCFPGPYTELFARKPTSQRHGWTAFGNATNQFPGEPATGPDICEELPLFLKKFYER